MTAKVFKLASRPTAKRISRDLVSAIVKNVPVPTPETPATQRIYPVDDLKIGESFSFPSSRKSSVAAVASKLKRIYPKREYTIRQEGDDRHRIWRVK